MLHQVPPNNETAMIAAVALGPVAVAIDGSDPNFQHYKSGVFGGLVQQAAVNNNNNNNNNN